MALILNTTVYKRNEKKNVCIHGTDTNFSVNIKVWGTLSGSSELGLLDVFVS